MKWAILLIFITLLPACDQGQSCQDREQFHIYSQPVPSVTEALPTNNLEISYFQSCQEFMDYSLEQIKLSQKYSVNSLYSEGATCSAQTLPATESDSTNINQPTNAQEQEVDESDRVKISKDYIFYTRENSVAVMDRRTKAFVKSIESPGYWRPYIYVANEHLIVIRPNEVPVVHNPNVASQLVQATQPVIFKNPEKFDVVFYDLRSFEIVKTKTINGFYQTSRLQQNGSLTIITRNNLRQSYQYQTNVDYLAALTEDIDCTKISKPVLNDTDLNLTSIHSINTNDLRSTSKESHLIGNYYQTYMNKNLYLTKSKKWFWFDNRPLATTNMQFTVRLNFENSEWVEKARLSYGGRTPSVWSFKELGNYFYIATTDNDGPGGQSTYFSVYENTSNTMELKNTITGIAPGERMRAVRYTEEFAYLVTFRVIDPLFVIDLKVKDDPRVVSELKIPGFSSYLHDTGNNKLIGVGYSGDLSRLQLSLFDVNDPLRPKALEQRLIGDSFSSSEAQHDHHSFFYDQEWQTMGIPIYRRSHLRNWNQISEQTGASIYSLSNNQFFHQATLTHSDWLKQHCDLSPNDYAWAIAPGTQDIARVHRIDGSLMTFSDFGARVHHHQDPNVELKRTIFNKPQEACPKPYPVCMVIE